MSAVSATSIWRAY